MQKSTMSSSKRFLKLRGRENSRRRDNAIPELVHRLTQGIYADGEYNVNKCLLLLDTFWRIELSSFHSCQSGKTRWDGTR